MDMDGIPAGDAVTRELIVDVIAAGDLSHPLFADWEDMAGAYIDLIQSGNGNVEAWQAVHRTRPAIAMAALVEAVLRCDAHQVAMTLHNVTETPAQYFSRLGDGLAFYENARYARFVSRESAHLFANRFPAWQIDIGF